MLILQLHHYSKEDKSYYREKVQYLMSPLSASYNETLKVVLGLHCLQMDAMQWSLWRTNPLWHATAHRSPDPNPNCRPAAPNQIRPETCLFISRIIFLDYHQYHEGTARPAISSSAMFCPKGCLNHAFHPLNPVSTDTGWIRLITLSPPVSFHCRRRCP